MLKKEFLQYAFTGILARVHAEEEKLQKQKDKRQIAIIEERLERLKVHAEEILERLRQV